MSGDVTPIYSTLDYDGEAGALLDRFVFALAERVDELQDAERESDLEQLGALARKLALAAGEAGYPDLVRVAEAVSGASAEDKPEEAQSGLVALTEISQRIRKGHRGAA